MDRYQLHLYIDTVTHPCKYIFEKTVYKTSLKLRYYKLFAWILGLLLLIQKKQDPPGQGCQVQQFLNPKLVKIVGPTNIAVGLTISDC